MAKFDSVLYFNPSNATVPVAFSATLDTDPVPKDVTSKDGGTVHRTKAWVSFFGTPPKCVGEMHDKAGDKGYKLPLVASFDDADYLASLKKGDGVIGLGYLYEGVQSGVKTIIVKKMLRGTGDTLYKSALEEIFLHDGDVPALVAGTYRNKFAREFSNGLNSTISVYKGADAIKKAFPEKAAELTLSEGNDYLNLSSVAFSYAAEDMKQMSDGDTIIAAGRLSIDEYNGVHRPRFYVERLISPRSGNTAGQGKGTPEISKEFVKKLFESADFQEALRKELQSFGLVLEISPAPDAGPGEAEKPQPSSSEDDLYGYLNE